MPKIQDVGVGNYIRNPRKVSRSSGVPKSAVMQVFKNDGNAFVCHPVKSSASGRVVLDLENYMYIPLDTQVDQVTI